MSMRLSDMNGSAMASNHPAPGGRVVPREGARHRRTLNLPAWIGVRTPPASFDPTWRREPLPPVRRGAADRVVTWVGEKRTPLVGGALSIALVGVLVGSSFNSPVVAEALQRSAGAPVQQTAQPPRPTPAVMSKPANSLARFAVAAGLPRAGQAVAGVSPGLPMTLAANAVPAAGSSTLSSTSSLPGAGEASAATGSSAPAARPSPSPALSPSPARPAVPPVAIPAVPAVPIPAVPLTAAEQTAADAAAAADLTAANALAAANLTEANALAAANLTAANAKAAADLTAANAAAAAAATAQAAADAAWAVAHP